MWLQSGVTFPHATCPALGPPALTRLLGKEELTLGLILGQEEEAAQEWEDTLFPGGCLSLVVFIYIQRVERETTLERLKQLGRQIKRLIVRQSRQPGRKVDRQEGRQANR